MESYESIVVNLDHAEDEDLGAGLRRINPQLPLEARLHLGNLLSQFLLVGGRDNVFKQMHGQTVGDLLKITPDTPTPVLKGKVDGMKFSLYEKPSDGKG